MDFWNSLDNTQKFVLGAAVATLIVAIVIYFCNRKTAENMNAAGAAATEDTTTAQEPKPAAPESEKVMVMFFAPWCGHCKNMAPTWEEFTKKWDGHNGVKIVKVDGEQNPQLAKLHGVGGFPTIKLCLYGLKNPAQVVDYRGNRSLPDLVNFLQNNS